MDSYITSILVDNCSSNSLLDKYNNYVCIKMVLINGNIILSEWVSEHACERGDKMIFIQIYWAVHITNVVIVKWALIWLLYQCMFVCMCVPEYIYIFKTTFHTDISLQILHLTSMIVDKLVLICVFKVSVAVCEQAYVCLCVCKLIWYVYECAYGCDFFS